MTETSEAFTAWCERRVTTNPKILGGTATIAGTRLSIATIAGFLAADETSERILAEYPYLTTEDLEYAPIYRRLEAILFWSKARGLPTSFLDKLPKLATRDPLVVREIADDLAELGYPFTANELRAQWRA